MKISLSPVRMDEQLALAVKGDVVTVNGEEFDFSPLLEGATLPRNAISSEWLIGDVERISGELVLTVRLPHGSNAPESTRFPQPIIVTEDGSVDLPIYNIEVLESGNEHQLVADGDGGNESGTTFGEPENPSWPGTVPTEADS